MLILESALVVPVPEAEPVVQDLRARFDPAAAAGLPAHITVIYPYLDPKILDESITRELEAILAGVSSFPFKLTSVARFPGVVYLVPEPGEPFSRLTAAIATRWPEAPPYGGIYDEVIPHLTVAQTSDAVSVEEIRKRIEPDLPLGCAARQVWLLTSRDDRWSVQHRFEFGGITA